MGSLLSVSSSSGASGSVSEVAALVHSGSFLHEHNTGINVANVTFNDLLIANGANDYVGSETKSWHLDGSIDVSYLATVVYKYQDENGNTLRADSAGEVHTVGETITCSTASAPDISGYMCVGVDPEGSLTLSESTTYYVTYIYAVKSYTVIYTDGVDDEGVFPDQVTERIPYGTATPAFNGTLTRPGYTFAGWSPAVTATVTADVTYTAQWIANTNTPYVVNHYQQDLEGDGYTLADTENKTGTTGRATNAVAKSYTGFTVQPFQQLTIKGDGTTEVNIYYNRNTFTVTYTDGAGGAAFADRQTTDIRYGTATPAFSGTPTR